MVITVLAHIVQILFSLSQPLLEQCLMTTNIVFSACTNALSEVSWPHVYARNQRNPLFAY